MVANKKHPSANQLTYPNFPSKRVWNDKKKQWEKKKESVTIQSEGCTILIYQVERDSLHILVRFVKAWKTFKDIKMFKGHVYETYKEACRAMRLLENDNKFYDCIVESAFWASVLYCEVTNP